MRIIIDQSGKIEDTNRLTAIAFSNGIEHSLIISAKEKRLVQFQLRRLGQPRVLISKVFAIGIFILIKNYINKIDTIIIDEEYPGKNHVIHDYLMELIRRHSYDFDGKQIQFTRIGKKVRAHSLAYLSFKSGKAGTYLKSNEIIKVITN